MSASPRSFVVHAGDNVATLLDRAEAGAIITILGEGLVTRIEARDAIETGHKIAVTAIPADQPVIKFGVRIGRATCDIAPGQWIHLHNCASFLDERSGTLDLHSGAATDTRYE